LHIGKRNFCILGGSGESMTNYFPPTSSLPDFVKRVKTGEELSPHFHLTATKKQKAWRAGGGGKGT